MESLAAGDAEGFGHAISAERAALEKLNSAVINRQQAMDDMKDFPADNPTVEARPSSRPPELSNTLDRYQSATMPHPSPTHGIFLVRLTGTAAQGRGVVGQGARILACDGLHGLDSQLPPPAISLPVYAP
jgi:hypothetical protein